MLTDSKEVALLSRAVEPGIRMPDRPDDGPAEIGRDFMRDRRFHDEHVLELGPGHYEFCEYVRSRGGRASVVELDPCVAELGRWRGFGVYVLDLRELSKLAVDDKFDGLFSKGSSNPFWYHADKAALERFIDALVQLVKLDGWIWVASCPWADSDLTPAQFKEWLEFERSLFEARGFRSWRIPNRYVGAFYGISVPCENLYVFTRGLPPYRLTLRSLLQGLVWMARHTVAKITR